MKDKKIDDLRAVKLFGLSILQWVGVIIVVVSVVILIHEYL
jgi:Trk-type K+ transport system membrane component